MIAVHTSILDNGYPSTVAVTNTGSTAATADLTIYDAQDGAVLGTYTTESISADGQVLLQVATIEQAIGFTPSSSTFHYNIQLTSSLDGYLQNLVDNQQVGVITDMSAVCTLTATTSSSSTTFEGAVSGSSESGTLSLTVDTDVETSSSSAQAQTSSVESASSDPQREGQTAVSSASGTFTPQNGTPVDLTGTYDSTAQTVSVSGSGYDFSGDIESADGEPRFSGEYTSPTSTGRVIAPKRTATNPIKNYCGIFTINNEEGLAEVSFNFSTSGTKVNGTFSDPEGSSGQIKGTISGRQITAHLYDFGTSTPDSNVSITINDDGSFSGSVDGLGRDATDDGPVTGSEC